MSLGYYCFLACVESWLSVAHRFVVVDGHSTDGSLSTLHNWVGGDRRLEILSNPLTHWGDHFAFEQSTLNMQLGHETLSVDCDWIIRVDADHILDSCSPQDLVALLQENSQQLSLSFDVLFFWNGRFSKRTSPRNWILNNRILKGGGCRVGWGKDAENGVLSDAPLEITTQGIFVDPQTGTVKPTLEGNRIPMGPTLPLKVYRYGHFFFTPTQSIEKCRIWDSAISDYLGRRKKNRLELACDADVVGIVAFMNKDDLFRQAHPQAILKVMKEYYKPNMLGGALYVTWFKIGVSLLCRSIRLFKKQMEFVLSHLRTPRGMNS